MVTVRSLAVALVAVLITAALTAASVAMITPDVFEDECARVQLVPPIECATPLPVATTAGDAVRSEQ